MPVDAVLYGIGLLFLLAILVPFSPMTIDLVPVSRARQIWIHRNRKVLWGVVVVAFGVVLVRGVGGALGVSVLGTADPGWLVAVAVTIGVAGMMFWMSYVPLVMTPPANPRVIGAADADRFIGADDVVLGVTGGGEARAYPRETISRPHFFEDTVGGQPLVISYCILCNSGIGFEASLDGRKLSLSCVTAYNNNIIYLEDERPNYIQQLDGAVTEGPDKGKKLRPYPLVQTTWREWKALHPETDLYYSPSTNLRDKIMDFMLKSASGAGKSMTLKCIAGIESPSQGQISLNGRILFDSDKKINLPASDRKVGIVLQNYALFPHLTVAENIAFGLQNISLAQRNQRIEYYLNLVELSNWKSYYPHQLSGGQKQRFTRVRKKLFYELVEELQWQHFKSSSTGSN